MVNPAERQIIYDAEGNEIDVTPLSRVDDPRFRLKFKNFLNAQIVDEFKQVNNKGGLRHLPVAHWDSQSSDIDQEQVQVAVNRHNILASIINLATPLTHAGIINHGEYFQLTRACYHDTLANFKGEEPAQDFRDASEFLDGPPNEFYERFTGMIDTAMAGQYSFELPTGDKVSRTQRSLLTTLNDLTGKRMVDVIDLTSRVYTSTLSERIVANSAAIQVFTDHNVDLSLPCFEAQLQLDTALLASQQDEYI